MTQAALPILVFLLASVSIGGVFVTVLSPRLSGKAALGKRLELATGGASAGPGPKSDKSRKKSVEDTLRELDEKQREKAKKLSKPSLLRRMRQGGLTWSKTGYWMVCGGTGLAVLLLVLISLDVHVVVAFGFAVAGGLLLPHLYVGYRGGARLKRFAAEFPNAVDVIVRGVKSGLPLVDCIAMIATEAEEPVKSEFKIILEDQTLGMPMDEAVQRLTERVPLPEATFFAIVITIQSRTGGSLSEALANLSKVLRERKKMKAKIKAMSAEAKASGGIIGSLPVVVASLVYLTSPDYIALLFTTLIGNVVLVGCGLWMLIGILVMRKMINFDF